MIMNVNTERNGKIYLSCNIGFDIEKRIKSDTEKIFKILGCSVYGGQIIF